MEKVKDPSKSQSSQEKIQFEQENYWCLSTPQTCYVNMAATYKMSIYLSIDCMKFVHKTQR